MDKGIRKFGTAGAAMLLTLLVGNTAIADDTELLLVNPGNAVPKPSILFILDSSGSMSTLENTRQIYNSSIAYPGICDANYYYWTEVDATPSCDPTNIQRILKSRYVCEGGNTQLAGIGSFTNIMAQYRDGASGFFSVFLGLSSFRWQKLEPGNENDLVECRRDAGNHGDGTAGEVYAQIGADLAPFTSDPKKQVAWGSWPTSQSVTVFDGNYLNYLANPTFVDEQRVDIMKNVATAVLNSIDNVNVGIMRFNNSDGGPVIHAVEDLDTNRTSILDAIDSITAGGATPLSETLYESALYWRGLPAYYGQNINEHATDPAALASTSPEVYSQPPSDVCAKNFNVLLTDGVPVNDQETPNIVDALPNWGLVMGQAGCTGGAQGDCLDDIGQYLFTDDISPEPGIQVVTTHTIGFSIDLPILEATAAASGGEYFLADDVESLTLAMLEIVNDIQDRSLSFAAPAVAVNTFNRTQNLNDLFLTTFAAREQVHWPGNLKKYAISGGEIVDANGVPAVNPVNGFFYDTASSFWSTGADGNDVRLGGAVENMPDSSARRLFTDNSSNPDLTAATNALDPTNADNFTDADFALTGSTEEPTREQLIRWARGEDILDEDFDPTTTERRAMGDPLHSQPAAIVYGGSVSNPEAVIYVATNDGYLHAIDGATGAELWSYIPKELLPNLVKLFFNPDSQFKNYGIDGNIVPVVKDVDEDGIVDPADGDFVYIIFGMRRGGSAYYALDVTDRYNPKLLWRVSGTEFGQSWSTPTVARIDIDDPSLNDDNAVVVIGGGYDPVHDNITHPSTPDGAGAGIYFLDLETGDIIWRASADPTADLTLGSMTRAFPTQIRVVDMNGDTFADRMYGVDISGQIFRFDIFNGNKPGGIGPDALVAGGVIAQLGAEGNLPATDAETRRFYNAPDVSVFNDNAQNRRFLSISVGSGYRASPLNNANDDRFYSVRDGDVFNSLSQSDYNTYNIIRDDDLVEVSGTVGTTITSNDGGWKFSLPADQKVLSTSVTFNNEVFFVAFSPDNAAVATCAAGRGRNFLYRVTVKNGDPIGDLDGIVPGTEDQSRVTDLAQGGIAPSPRFLFPSPDDDNCTGDDCAPPPIGCIGVECFNPGFDNNPVRTLWTADGIE